MRRPDDLVLKNGCSWVEEKGHPGRGHECPIGENNKSGNSCWLVDELQLRLHGAGRCCLRCRLAGD